MSGPTHSNRLNALLIKIQQVSTNIEDLVDQYDPAIAGGISYNPLQEAQELLDNIESEAFKVSVLNSSLNFALANTRLQNFREPIQWSTGDTLTPVNDVMGQHFIIEADTRSGSGVLFINDTFLADHINPLYNTYMVIEDKYGTFATNPLVVIFGDQSSVDGVTVGSWDIIQPEGAWETGRATLNAENGSYRFGIMKPAFAGADPAKFSNIVAVYGGNEGRSDFYKTGSGLVEYVESNSTAKIEHFDGSITYMGEVVANGEAIGLPHDLRNDAALINNHSRYSFIVSGSEVNGLEVESPGEFERKPVVTAGGTSAGTGDAATSPNSRSLIIDDVVASNGDRIIHEISVSPFGTATHPIFFFRTRTPNGSIIGESTASGLSMHQYTVGATNPQHIGVPLGVLDIVVNDITSLEDCN